MYIIEQGEVVYLIHKTKRATLRKRCWWYVVFTGSRHAVTAVATADTTVWVLRKRDFENP
jgi:hypothetical protein